MRRLFATFLALASLFGAGVISADTLAITHIMVIDATGAPPQMSSAAPGPNTLVAEVTNVSRHGFWLLLGQEELFVPFADFPWFASEAIGELVNVEWPSPEHLYWPVLDVDLSVESIRHLERFPLVSRVTDS